MELFLFAELTISDPNVLIASNAENTSSTVTQNKSLLKKIVFLFMWL